MNFSDRIEIWTCTLIRTATGHTAGPWTLLRVVWGRVIPLSVSNQVKFQQRGHAQVTDEIVVGGALEFQLDDATTKTQFRCDGQAYRPLEVGQKSGRRGSMRIPVLEVA